MADKLITDLQELDAITGDTYVPVRNAASGTRKYNLKALKDTVDAAAQAADDAATDARAAAANVDASKEAAQQAAATANDASQRAEAAIEAIGDISELAVPLMSETTRGGATLGQGLTVDGGALSIGDIVTDETDGPIYSVDAKGWAEQDGTPTPDNPQEVRVARGRNLLNFNAPRKTGDFSAQTRNMDGNGVWVGITANNYYNNSRIQNLTESDGVTTFTCIQAGYGIGIEAAVAPNTEYAWSAVHNENTQVSFGFYTSGGSYIGMSSISSSGSGVITTPSDCAYMTMVLRAKSDGVSCEYRQVQLELGSIPTPYVPYGHVGLEVRDSSDELVSVTPIPLPSRGFAAALPDGTADALAIDSAGRCEWDAPVGAVDMGTLNWYKSNPTDDGTATVYRLVFNAASTSTRNIQCDSFQCIAPLNPWERISLNQIMISGGFLVAGGSSDYASGAAFKAAVSGVMLYYPLITTTTEHAYIDLPTIPEGAVIDIPELREVGVKCFVPGMSELIDHANNWGERCKQNESRIAALEAAIANLATS